LTTGVLQTSDVAGTAVTSWLLPQALLASAKQYTKLNGVKMMRANIEVTIKVNATRFQQGRYFLRFVHAAGGALSPSMNSYMQAHVCDLRTSTSGLRVEVDLATETSAVMTIPFLSVYNYFMTTGENVIRTLGRLYLIPYDPLQAGSGDTTCQYTVWARLTNIVLSGDVVVQSRKSLQFKEAAAGGVGPISTIAAKVGRTMGVFDSVPLLSTYTKTVGWLSDLVGQAASIWGYSKPTNMAMPEIITRKTAPNMANFDGVFNGHKLATMSTNEVIQNTGRACTNVDEMSHDFIITKSAWLGTVNWADSASAGSSVGTFDTGVGLAFDNKTYAKGITLVPVDYLSLLYQYYRGSLVYTFKIVKTEFHSGRLVIAWVPAENGLHGVAPTTIADTDNLQRIIWDVRESNEVTITTPYAFTSNFTRRGLATGKFYIFVLNELIAPSTVSASVNILIEKAGHTDIEFAFPSANLDNTTLLYDPYIPFQSAEVQLGKSSSPPILLAESIGEAIRSIRSLLKRPSLWIHVENSNTIQTMSLFPNLITPVTQPTSNASALYRASTGDIMGFLTPLYAMYKGSVRVWAHINGNDLALFWSVFPIQATPTGTLSLSSVPDFSYRTPQQVVDHGLEGLSMIEVPPYLLQGARPVGNIIASSVGVYATTAGDTDGGLNLGLRVTTGTSFNTSTYMLNVYRSVGDDFALSGWNGTVPLVANYVS
jgi:hypothetical protein